MEWIADNPVWAALIVLVVAATVWFLVKRGRSLSPEVVWNALPQDFEFMNRATICAEIKRKTGREVSEDTLLACLHSMERNEKFRVARLGNDELTWRRSRKASANKHRVEYLKA